MSYAVTERTHEIGIRMALGASADRVLRDIVGRGLRLTLIALAIGVPAAIGIARLARGVLFGVDRAIRSRSSAPPACSRSCRSRRVTCRRGAPHGWIPSSRSRGIERFAGSQVRRF